MQPITKHEGIYATLAILAMLVVLGFMGYAATHTRNTAFASSGAFALQCVDSTNFVATTTPGYGQDCSGNASSTQDYLGAGLNVATSTIETVNISAVNAVDVNIFAGGASSTASIQNYSLWVSYNQIDWYPLQSNTFALTGAASTTNIHLTNLNDRYLQLRARSIAASSTVYSQFVLQAPIAQ